MQKPSLGWQSWSPAFPKWHGYPKWDYSPFPNKPIQLPVKKTKKNTHDIRYWCSWYAYGWDINDKKINNTINSIKQFKLPFTHILIDDGWTVWGDWHTPNLTRFPNIVATIKSIKSNGLHAGLWFAPFLANRQSCLFKDHPDWFIKYKGLPIQGLKTLPIWESLIPQQYLLDFNLPEVKKYITNFIDLAVNKWGITLIKLDFLYAPYFNPNHESDQLPHNQVSWLLSYIKKHYPKVTTIACGAPFAPSIKYADIIRISKDTALPPPIPSFFNRIFYHHRVQMLMHKTQAINFPFNINIDPDVRIFSLDSSTTNSLWSKISSNIIGVGDNLTNLSTKKINEVKQWLTKHNSQ